MAVYDPFVRRKIFISYHHRNDQLAYNLFVSTFCSAYDVFYDQSLDNRIRSDDSEYVNRRIREEFIFGSSITIVLCGAETGKRKYVDWEIYSTLHYQHALLGIVLPSAQRNASNQIIIPDRLFDNVVSGYAHNMNWPSSPAHLQEQIVAAKDKSRFTSLINNSRQKMGRNLS